MLFQAERLGIGAIPIIVDDSFQFPSDALFQELRALSADTLSGTDRAAEDLITLIKKLFEEIGIHVRPQDSQRVLEVGDVRLAQNVREMMFDLVVKRCIVNRHGITPTVRTKECASLPINVPYCK